MGKTNKANRTKGNTRPSSSGHSAELLGLSGRGFVGFDALGKDTPTYVPVTGQNATADSTVDADFRMVMRKMLKRDAVTRLKAVQEFGDYCLEKEIDTVKNVLPFWPRLFNRLALDFDRRVREATHVANGKLLSKVKREVAPHLKSLMGVWLIGQCDTHAPASSAALATFAATFPPPKQPEAVLFCRAEIFAYFKDNLFEQTAKSMSEPNTSSPEDIESKYHMVISATLQAIKLFLVTAKSNDNDGTREDVRSVVMDTKFWKFAKNKEAQIRGAWYSLIGTVCQQIPEVFEGMEKKLATTVFGCLSESDPVVAPFIWESALSIAVNVENCWQGIDLQKVALPQLWSLLQGGGRGNASVLFPCLLPLLSRLPAEVAESETFLRQFFACFGKSLMLESVKLSTTECDAILSALFECLQFMCCTRLGEKGPPLLEEILTNEVVPILESSLCIQEGSHLALSRLYPLLAALLGRLERHGKVLHEVLDRFWQQALSIVCKIFASEERREMGLVFTAYLFNSLLQTLDGRREKRTVRFRDEEGETPQEDPPPPDKRLDSPSALAVSGAVSLPHIADFCANLCKEIEESNCPLGYLRLLEEVLMSANSRDLVLELVKVFSKDERYAPESTKGFVEVVILKWLWRVRKDNERLSCLINVLLLLCSFVPQEEAREMLDSCCKVDVDVLEQLLRQGLSSCRDHPFFRHWLESSCSSFGLVGGLNALVEKEVFFSEAVPRWSEVEGRQRILELCLCDKDTELLIDDSRFDNVLLLLNDLSTQLFSAKMEEKNSELAVNFIHKVTAAVLSNPKRCWKFNATEQLVHLLFKISLKDVPLFENSVSQFLFDILDASINSYCSAREEVTTDSSLILWMAKELNVTLHSLQDQKEASHLQKHCLFLLSTVKNALSRHNSATAIFASHKMAEAILPSPTAWDSLKEGLALNVLPFFLKKKIFFPLTLDGEFFYPEEKVRRLTLASKVVAGILCSETLNFGDPEDEAANNYVIEHMPQLLWGLTFCRATRKRNEMAKDSFERLLKKSCFKMLLSLQPSEADTLKKNIFDLSVLDGQWALCLQTLGEILPSYGLRKFAEEQFQSSSILSMREGVEVHMLRQVLIPHLPSEQKKMLFEELLIELSSMEDLTDKNFAGKVGEVCCYFQDSELLLSLELQGLLMSIFITIAPYITQSDDELRITYHLQIESIVSSAVQHGVYLLNSEVWDFLMEQLLVLMKASCSETLATPRSLVTLYRTLNIFISLSRLFLASHEQDPETLLDWKPSPLAEVIHKRMIRLFIQVAMRDEKTFLPESCGRVLTLLLEAVKFLPAEELLDSLMSTGTGSLQPLIPFLSSTVRQLQLASHVMLLKMMPLLPKLLCEVPQSEEDSEDDSEKREEFERLPDKLSPLLETMVFLNEVVESMLCDVKIGDLCTVVPFTDSYCISMAYLLGWIQLLEFIAASPSQIRLGYATDLEEKKLLLSLFSNVFRMMPENPFLCLKKGLKVETPRKEDLKMLFLQPPALHPGAPSSEEIQSVACYVFAMALRKVPASIRTWWNNLDRKSADIVNNFTTKYVSGHLCTAEILAVHENEKQFENLMVQARPGSREVVATYTVDDCPIELCVTLPLNHPLGPISAERRGRVVINQVEWRHWLMQLTTLLAYQNGSILDGLSLWKRNLDKKFEGVEECMICYYVLHSTTLKLPRLSCHVCRKKFHSACLYKWFRTSNNSTCPLCRTEFIM